MASQHRMHSVTAKQWAFLVGAWLWCWPAFGQRDQGEVLVPAVFQAVTDQRGNFWNVAQQGIINTGSNAFQAAGALTVRGVGFAVQQMQMTQDHSEYVLSGTCGMFRVVRRIKIDPNSSSARFVELITNNGPADTDAEARITTNMQFAGLYSEGGNLNPASLDDKSSGLVATSRFGNFPMVGFWLTSPKAKLKPAVSAVRNRNVQLTFKLSLPAGKTVGLIHGISQYPMNGVNANVAPDAATIAAALAPFDAKSWGKDLPPEIRNSLVNYAQASQTTAIQHRLPLQPMLDALAEANQTLRDVGTVEPGEADVLVVDGQPAMKGDASSSGLTVSSRFGKVSLELADLSMIVGGAGGLRRPCFFLRNGEVVVGDATVDKFVFKSYDGLTVELDAARLNMLVLGLDLHDNQPPEGAAAFVTISSGDRLAVNLTDGDRLSAATPWGMLNLPLAAVRSLVYQPQPQPGFRLGLADRSQLTVLLTGPAWKLKTTRWGQVSLAPNSVRRVDGIELPKATAGENAVGEAPVANAVGEPAELAEPHVQLVDDGVLIGEIQEPKLHLATAGNINAVAPRFIESLRRSESSEGQFECRLADGREFTAALVEPVVTVKFGEQSWHIPVVQLAALRGAAASATPGKSAAPARRAAEKAGAPQPGEVRNPFADDPFR